MKALVLNICEVMNNISLAFEGTLGKDNPEMKAVRNDLLSGNIPSISSDKANFKKDGRNIVGDFKVAYEEYVETHTVVSE